MVYFARLAARGGRLLGLEMVPLRIRNFRLERPGAEAVAWLGAALDREYRRFGASVETAADGRFRLRWG